MDCIAIKDIRSGMKNINVIFIVLEIQAATKTKENREVFSFKVADMTASINCSIWDEPGKFCQPGDIIKLTKAYASLWRGSLTLYSGKNGEIMKMGDFCMVFNEQINMSEPIVAQQQNSAVQGNHINSNNGNGGNNGNNGNNSRSTTAANQPPIIATTTSSVASSSNQNSTPTNSQSVKQQKSPANPPSKSYMRKPIKK